MTNLVLTMGDQRLETAISSADADAGEPAFAPVQVEDRIFGDVSGLELAVTREALTLVAEVSV